MARKAVVHFPVFSSTVFSIFIYSVLLSSIFFYLSKDNTKAVKYTANKDNFLDIAIVERDLSDKPKSPPKDTKKQEAKKIEKHQEDIKEQAVKTSKKRANLQELFKGVKAKKAQVKPIAQNKEAAVQSRKKSSKKSTKSATALVKNLQLDIEQTSSKSQSTGVYDEYLGKINDILLNYWQETIETVSGLKGIAEINIDKNGNFSYNITRLSHNQDFNQKFRDFLVKMQSVSFPTSPTNKSFSAKVTFKDSLELWWKEF